MTASEIARIVITVGMVQALCDLIAYWRIYSQQPYRKAIIVLEKSKTKLELAKKELSEVTTTSSDAVAGAGTASITAKNNNKSSIISSNSSNNNNNNNNTNTKKKKIEKNAIKVNVAEKDYKEAISVVARYHTLPGMMTSIFFLIVLRILGTEYHGSIVAVLPFQPFPFLRKITARGLTFQPQLMMMNDKTAVPYNSKNPIDLSKIRILQQPGDNSTDEAVPNNKANNANAKSSVKVESAVQACSFMFIYMLATFSVKVYVHKWFGIEPPSDVGNGGMNTFLQMFDSPSGQRTLEYFGVDLNDLK